jgi:hypothetical protein
MRQRQAQNGYNLRPPHYVPSFLNGSDARPAQIDARLPSRSVRQVSRGFWTVGGRLSVQHGQLQGVPAASGDFLVSGSTAPMHTATFLDQATSDDKVKDHERRLALALGIDQASRVLLQPFDMKLRAGHILPQHSPFVWRDNTWRRNLSPLCESDFGRIVGLHY